MPQKTIFIYLADDFPPVLKQQILKFAKPIIEFNDNSDNTIYINTYRPEYITKIN